MLTTVVAVSVGGIAVNMYASQPILEVIGSDIGLGGMWLGLVPAMTMLGYSAGLLLLVPLLDLLENRRLIIATMLLCVLALASAAASGSAATFLFSSLIIGVGASAIHMLVPTAAFLTSEEHRGRAIGVVQCGMVIGVFLSRPLASLITFDFGWRVFYFGAAMIVLSTIVSLSSVLPRHTPSLGGSYPRLLFSLCGLLREQRVLRRRTAYQVLCMAAFGAFWTVLPLRLAQPPFDLGQRGIAAFTLAGITGIIMAPVAGWVGDLGLTRPATRFAHTLIVSAMVVASISGTVTMAPTLALGLLLCCAVAVDTGFIVDQTLGRREINMLQSAVRGRANGLFTGILFLGGTIGSGVATQLWFFYGWPSVCAFAGTCGIAALLIGLFDDKAVRP